ncbi:hypothetical protein MNBD_NITROSPINAE02-1588, partial [hydrothermal vent metagenome]
MLLEGHFEYIVLKLLDNHHPLLLVR